MALFNKIKGQSGKEAPVQQAPAPSMNAADYAHLRAEVTSMTGELYFVAKLMYPSGNTAELHQYSESSLPEDSEPVRARIRGYHDHTKTAVYMEGIISPLPKHIWQVEELEVKRVGNERALFRLDTNIPAHVTKFSGIGMGESPCRLLNISVGGARISSKQRFWEGDKLLLNVKLFEDRDNSIMFCEVLRVIEQGNEVYEYGCQFLELTEADEAKITQSIFILEKQKRDAYRQR